MSLSTINATAATLTKNRTEGSVVPTSGMCVTCVDGCIGMCEIGKSAYRGHEVIYPQPFGVITTAGEKAYPVDYSHFNIMGTAVGAHGIAEVRRVARTGLVARVPGRNPRAPVVALRGDVDALPIAEATGPQHAKAQSQLQQLLAAFPNLQ